MPIPIRDTLGSISSGRQQIQTAMLSFRSQTEFLFEITTILKWNRVFFFTEKVIKLCDLFRISYSLSDGGLELVPSEKQLL